MTAEEIKAQIAKVQKNSFLPDSVKKVKIAKLEAELKSATKGASKPAEKKSAKLSQEDWERQVIDKMMDLEELSNSDAQGVFEAHSGTEDYFESGMSPEKAAKKILGMESAPKAPKKAKKEKKEKAPSAGPKRSKPKTQYTFAGKNLDEIGCEELYNTIRARIDKNKKSQKKSKTKPLIEKVTDNAAQAADAAIKNIPVAKIKKDPEAWAEKIREVHKATKEFVGKLKTILGSEYDASAVTEELKHILHFATEIEKKYAD